MKRAVVVGSLGNLGPVWVETLIEMGFDVRCLDPPEFDASNEECVTGNARACEVFWGAPDIVIYNAAIDNPPVPGTTFWLNKKRIVEVNLIGAMNVYEAFLPMMIKNGGGLLINVGSIQGRIGADWRNYPPGIRKPVGYNASKAALEQLTRSSCTDYGEKNIRAVTMAFGPYDNGKFDPVFKEKILRNIPIGRLVQKESLKATLRYVIECPELTGQTVLVDGGYTAW
jgi:meso-butanediol dehydrogenase / (S,S)-butanediol dehydrogenase / diacetyl reductase